MSWSWFEYLDEVAGSAGELSEADRKAAEARRAHDRAEQKRMEDKARKFAEEAARERAKGGRMKGLGLPSDDVEQEAMREFRSYLKAHSRKGEMVVICPKCLRVVETVETEINKLNEYAFKDGRTIVMDGRKCCFAAKRSK